jgi:hypothetical protein
MNWKIVAVIMAVGLVAFGSGRVQAEGRDEARAKLAEWLESKKGKDLGDKEGCTVRADYPGWEGVPLSDCVNEHAINKQIKLTGRTLFIRVKPDRIARWIVSACAGNDGAVDMVCARATACKVIIQSGTQFPVAGLNVESYEKEFDQEGIDPLLTGVISTPSPRPGVSRSLLRVKTNTECRTIKQKPCTRYRESKLLNYVFYNGVTVVREGLSPDSNWQLSIPELAALVASDARDHLIGTYTSDGPARLSHTTRRQYWEYAGKQGPAPNTKSLEWPDKVGALTKQALTQDDNPVLHAWVASGDYKRQLNLDRLPSCSWK